MARNEFEAGARENVDEVTVASFGAEWERYDQTELSPDELQRMFNTYFRVFPWSSLPEGAVGFDMGCGSGRWAALVAPRVGSLVCIDPSLEALNVARKALAACPNVELIAAPANSPMLPENRFDFGYSLGVLHHVPDTRAALAACVRLLKPSAPFLVYIYYRFDNRPLWFRTIWSASEIIRAVVSRLPKSLKSLFTDLIATLVYWPLARFATLLERIGGDPTFLPLSFYRNMSFYTMRTDSRDRFGTPLEQRFTQLEIKEMMTSAGLENIRFSEREPFWVAVGTKRR